MYQLPLDGFQVLPISSKCNLLFVVENSFSTYRLLHYMVTEVFLKFSCFLGQHPCMFSLKIVEVFCVTLYHLLSSHFLCANLWWHFVMACEQAPHWVQSRCQKTGKKPSASRERDRCGKISNELFLVISKIMFIVHVRNTRSCFRYCISQFQPCQSPPDYRGAFAGYVSPRGGSLANFAWSGGGALPTPGPPWDFETHMVSYPNITKSGGFSWKYKPTGKLALLSRMWKGCRVFLRHVFMILCVHFFTACQARTYIAKSGAIDMSWDIFLVIKSNFCWSRMCIKFSGDDSNQDDTCSFTAH